jgi:hypothetical protein
MCNPRSGYKDREKGMELIKEIGEKQRIQEIDI